MLLERERAAADASPISGRAAAKAVDVETQVPVRERPLFARRQTDGQRPREADHRENDVPLRDVVAQSSILDSAGDDGLHQRPGAYQEIGPVVVLKQRVDHVDHADAVVQRGVHVPAQRLDAIARVCEDRLARLDALLQRVTSHGVKQRLLVGEVPVERPDADTGAFGDRIARRLSADLQDQFDRHVQEPLTVSLCICAHMPCCCSSIGREGQGGSTVAADARAPAGHIGCAAEVDGSASTPFINGVYFSEYRCQGS